MNSLFRDQMEIIGNIPVDKIKLLVLILSFNQDEFLENAIASVLSQDYTDEFRVIIHDDASTDSSAEVIRQAVKNHPNQIVGILQTNNKFSAGVNILEEIHKLIPSEYVARLDADDFWLSKDKLSKQVKFLDKNLDTSLSAHSVLILDEVNKKTSLDKLRVHGFQLPNKFSLCNFVSTASVMYRADLAKPLPSSFTNQYIQDWPLWSILANRGRVYFHDDLLSVYRIHSNNGFARKDNSVFSADTLAINLMIASFLKVNRYNLWKVTYFLRKTSSNLDKFFAYKASTVLNLFFNFLVGIRREPMHIQIDGEFCLLYKHKYYKHKRSTLHFSVDNRAIYWF
jgi:glycosyltransferase involved in cell wall biosynthesis